MNTTIAKANGRQPGLLKARHDDTSLPPGRKT
jgi:hypothetical protein